MRADVRDLHGSVASQNASGQQCAPTAFVTRLRDLEDEVRCLAAQRAREQSLSLEAADLGHRALRTPVLLADPEQHRVCESEGVIEHQPLDLAVRSASPVAAGEKGPTDLYLAAFMLVV